MTSEGNGIELVYPRWPAAQRVHACTTTRVGGVSKPPFDGLNLAAHVGDNANAVAVNRQRLQQQLDLPSDPVWLRQVHGAEVVDATQISTGTTADGSVVNNTGVVCAVLTADCLPLFLCDRAGTQVGLLHVGWRGLAADVIERGVSMFGAPASELLAWLGPSIGPQAFEVGADVRELLMKQHTKKCFTPAQASGKWLVDLYGLVAERLRDLGVTKIFHDAALCTFKNAEWFFSYRRDGQCGRMASLIWIEE